MSDFFGLETVTKATQPLIDFFKKSLDESVPDPEGSLVDRYLWEMKKEEKAGNSDSAYFGKRGQVHLQGTVLDLFIAGKIGHIILIFKIYE